MLIKSHAPVRVDFAGAWTDVPYFSDPFTGATLNAAIQIYVSGQMNDQERIEGSAADEDCLMASDTCAASQPRGLLTSCETHIAPNTAECVSKSADL